MNKEHYKDPTAEKAVLTVSRGEEKRKLIIRTMQSVAKLGGYKVVGRITLEDKRTGDIYL